MHELTNSLQSLIPILLITSALTGCSNDKSTPSPTSNTPVTTPPHTQVNPPAKAASRLELTASDMTVDHSGAFPRFKVSKALTFADKVQIYFNLEELNNPTIAAREQFLVPFDADKEVTAAIWSVESPVKLSHANINNLEISRDDIKDSEEQALKFYNITEGPNLTFKLRIIFSDSVGAGRTSLAIIELPLL